MTRKDYVLIAEAIKNARDIVANQSFSGDQKVQFDIVIDAVSLELRDVLATDNPRFDAHRFMIATGWNSDKYTTV